MTGLNFAYSSPPARAANAWIIGAIPVQLTESKGCTLQAQAEVFVAVLGCSGMLEEIPMRSSPAWPDFAGAARVRGVM